MAGVKLHGIIATEVIRAAAMGSIILPVPVPGYIRVTNFQGLRYILQ